MYVTGSPQGFAEFAWVDRSGRARPVDPSWQSGGALVSMALSPDGRTLAAVFISTAGGEDVWIKQLDDGPLSRLTFDAGNLLRPSWTPDGRSVLYTGSDSAGNIALFKQRADGSGAAERVIRFGTPMVENLPSRDGRWIVTRSVVGAGLASEGDLFAFRPGVDTVATPLLTTRFREQSPALSPDARWLAYASNESGRLEVYVRPFPNTAEARWQVSVAGGSEPRWAHSGQELFYRNGAGDLIAAEVRATPTFAVLSQQSLFPAATFATNSAHHGYEVSPDDQRFLMARLERSEEGSDLSLVQNWFEELKQIGKP